MSKAAYYILSVGSFVGLVTLQIVWECQMLVDMLSKKQHMVHSLEARGSSREKYHGPGPTVLPLKQQCDLEINYLIPSSLKFFHSKWLL